MDRIAKALAEHDEVFADVTRVLFGDGADELISKLSDAEKKAKSERLQARVGLATNVIGIGAGLAATPTAVREAKRAYKARKQPSAVIPQGAKMGQRLKALPKNKKVAAGLAAGAAGLQVANLGGDFVANRVLARSAKQDVTKNNPDGADFGPGVGKKLKLAAKGVDYVSPTLKEKAGKIVAKPKQEGGKKIEVGLAKSDETEILWEGEFSKVDDEKRQVFGWASITKLDGVDVVDRQDDYISTEEIEKSAYNYVHRSRAGGDMHRRTADDRAHHVSDMIESVVFTDEKIAKMGLPDDFPRGWWVGYQIHDDDTWNLVKSGKRQGFSIHGRGQRISKVLA